MHFVQVIINFIYSLQFTHFQFIFYTLQHFFPLSSRWVWFLILPHESKLLFIMGCLNLQVNCMFREGEDERWGMDSIWHKKSFIVYVFPINCTPWSLSEYRQEVEIWGKKEAELVRDHLLLLNTWSSRYSFLARNEVMLNSNEWMTKFLKFIKNF